MSLDSDRHDELASLRQQVKIAREALEKMKKGAGWPTTAPYWRGHFDGWNEAIDAALKLMDHPDD